jgi:hypothetical protein
MYDVVYFSRGQGESLVGAGLAREAACELARAEARKRKVGRMFLAGSEPPPRSELIVIVESRLAA